MHFYSSEESEKRGKETRDFFVHKIWLTITKKSTTIRFFRSQKTLNVEKITEEIRI